MYVFCVLAVAACKIENDIPYPIVEGNIISMEVEDNGPLMKAAVHRR